MSYLSIGAAAATLGVAVNVLIPHVLLVHLLLSLTAVITFKVVTHDNGRFKVVIEGFGHMQRSRYDSLINTGDDIQRQHHRAFSFPFLAELRHLLADGLAILAVFEEMELCLTFLVQKEKAKNVVRVPVSIAPAILTFIVAIATKTGNIENVTIIEINSVLVGVAVVALLALIKDLFVPMAGTFSATNNDFGLLIVAHDQASLAG